MNNPELIAAGKEAEKFFVNGTDFMVTVAEDGVKEVGGHAVTFGKNVTKTASSAGKHISKAYKHVIHHAGKGFKVVSKHISKGLKAVNHEISKIFKIRLWLAQRKAALALAQSQANDEASTHGEDSLA
jgi:hypothetical protein